MRNYALLEEAELNRLASLSSPSGRRAREELARREQVAVNMRENTVVAERRRAREEERRRMVETSVGPLEVVAKPGGHYEVRQGERVVRRVHGRVNLNFYEREQLEAGSGSTRDPAGE